MTHTSDTSGKHVLRGRACAYVQWRVLQVEFSMLGLTSTCKGGGGGCWVGSRASHPPIIDNGSPKGPRSAESPKCRTAQKYNFLRARQW